MPRINDIFAALRADGRTALMPLKSSTLRRTPAFAGYVFPAMMLNSLPTIYAATSTGSGLAAASARSPAIACGEVAPS